MDREPPPPVRGAVTFAARWAHVLTCRHTAGQWRHISAAIRRADTATGPRGGEDWCRRVLTALPPEQIAAADPQHQYRQRVQIDPDLLRAWLTAPVDQAGLITVADTLGLVDFGRAGDHATHRALTRLLPAAHHTGLFGVAGTIDVHRVVDPDDRYQGTILTIRPDGATRLATAPMLDWTPPPHQNLIDSAVATLTALARTVNSTLDNHARLVRAVAAPPHRQNRGFPPIDGQRPAEAPGQDHEPVPDGVDGYSIGGRQPKPAPHPLSTVDTPQTGPTVRPQPTAADRTPGRSR